VISGALPSLMDHLSPHMLHHQYHTTPRVRVRLGPVPTDSLQVTIPVSDVASLLGSHALPHGDELSVMESLLLPTHQLLSRLLLPVRVSVSRDSVPTDHSQVPMAIRTVV
jgi:hypothetical protein